ncbi:flavin reductase family protein [Neptunicoccus cionae]|uniref:Flavin reductase n=1 Tax=Neptunicoccus cionae TaxID=2035344 RepID=A0A916QUA6_9RHOB|nr:flavin reductase family protein [Amylibacter cionae]GGA08105.1 flavin reductase [Amylibacter cionae]
MFYRPGHDDHGLPHNPYKAIVSPRPIGWISTLTRDGTANLAPYSFFNGVADDPPMVMFSTTGKKIGRDEVKDSLTNIRDTGEFCVSIVSHALKDAMNLSSGHYAPDEDEFTVAGLEKGTPNVVKAPFVAAAPAALECKLFKEIELPGGAVMVLGEVVGIHIRDEHITDGILDVTSYQPMARLGYRDYSAVTDIFSLNRPGQK